MKNALLPLILLLATTAAAGESVMVSAANPAPGKLPTLSVYKNDQDMLMVAARFPDVPDFTCESWCYESEVDFVDARPLDGGKLALRHRDRLRPALLYVTMVIPEQGSVEFAVSPELDTGKAPKDAKIPENLPGLNMCWQLKKAPAFASRPEPYPEFVKRCFIFTDAGQTFLNNTTRRLIPCRKPDDEYNNPPWVQSYVGVWCKIPEVDSKTWADYSPDRFTMPIIGAVSRDGKYLAALANDTAGTMCQAWHDCLHDNPQWIKQPDGRQVWRVKVYVMANDPAALVARAAADFPNAKKLAENRIPPMGATGIPLHFRTRTLAQDAAGETVWTASTVEKTWNPRETAIIICDMWDKQWARGAAERVDAIAPKMNRVVEAARDCGITIIHAPSETMDFYRNSPARKRLADAPKAPFPKLADHANPPLPIDDSDGGSDTGERVPYKAWHCQHPAIRIDQDKDGISDSGAEIWNFCHQNKITNILIMGVHANMCILNRSFGIKNMVRHGMNIALARDLTDALYNPAMPPHVSQQEGTRLVIEYIEKYWCPTMESKDLLSAGRQ